MWKEVNLLFGCLMAKQAEGDITGFFCNGRLCAVMANTLSSLNI
jgi:hypothetical protein